MSKLIFEKSQSTRCSKSLTDFTWSNEKDSAKNSASDSKNDRELYFTIEQKYLRTDAAHLPEVSELEVVRHYTKLSTKNFSIDTNFYPLGSCTMKYNPRIAHKVAALPGFLARHPLAHDDQSQGFLSCLYELQEMLVAITGMQEVSLTPMAGAQGEFAGVLMIKAYHEDHKDFERTEMLVPDSAHGTNPASAVMCGFKVKEIPTLKNGDLDLEALKKAVGPKTAGIMLTNPSTLGVFERDIEQIAKIVHEAGGLLYYDGANLNAILGRVRPGDMGFDVMHMNLHKTFATPHGGGGPGSGPVAANKRLAKYLPIPIVGKRIIIKRDVTDVTITDKNDGTDKRNGRDKYHNDANKHNNNQYYWLEQNERPQSIGRLSAFMGNAGVLLRAYIYIKMLGREGLRRVSDFATLNANYLSKKLEEAGLPLAFSDRMATHEFVVTLKKFSKENDISAMDLAKRLLDEGFHAPTTYFPLLVPECWLIEPTETETKETLDQFIAAIKIILKEVESCPEKIKQAPHTLGVSRLDDVRAVRELDIVYRMDEKNVIGTDTKQCEIASESIY